MRRLRAPVWPARLLGPLLVLALAARADAATDRQTRTVPLPPDRALVVEITIGSVRVEGWDRADAEITVERQAPTAARLDLLPLVIDATAERVTVRAVQADGATDPALTATVVLRVPRAAFIDRIHVQEGRLTVDGVHGRVTAVVERGPIEGRDLSGTLRFETGIGSIALTRARLVPGGLLRLRTFNGDVRLALAERPADARILALAVNGTIQSTIPLNARDTWGPHWAEATLGRGEPVISLDVITGTIDIKSP